MIEHASLARKLYDELPDSIKDRFTFEQWSWLPDLQKARLVSTSTEPEWSE